MPDVWSRRAVLRGTLAAAAVAALPRVSSRAAEPGLRALADARGMLFGTAVEGRDIRNPAAAALIRADCNVIVPRNALKWNATEKRQGKFSFGEADQILRFGRENGMAVRGHALVWHNAPKWVGAITDSGELEAAMIGHIEGVAGHCAGDVSSWDVVNEPLEYDDPKLRDSVFLRLLGEDYIGTALRAARAAAPGAQLIINETHLCKAGDNYAARRALMLEVLGRLQDRGVPIDAIGVQGHFRPGFDRLDADGFGAFCRELKARGLKVLITELDASCRFTNRIDGFTEADYAPPFRELIEVAASEGDLSAVLVWGLSSRGATDREPEGPNKACKVRVNLYGDDDQPLPTRAAVAAALEAI